jgi:predicted HTH transcriptional regulator
MASACADQVEPSIRAQIEVITLDDLPVVVAAVPSLDRAKKPCFVKTQGLERGSYIRTHDGDRHLSMYEIHALMAGRGQPKSDVAPVEGVTLTDLLEHEVDRYIYRLRDMRGTVFTEASNEQILRMTSVLAPEGQGPTLAGLLALGRFPQQFLPQLNATFVAFPTVDARPMSDGTRFLDNVSVDGPIPQIVEGVWAALSRNTTRAAVVHGMGREDVVMPHSEHTVAESRGTGLFVVATELERAGLPPLDIKADLLSFTATIRKTEAPHPVAKSEVEYSLTARQREILMHLEGGPKSSQDLAEALGVTREAVQQHLRRLEASAKVFATTKSRYSRHTRWQATSV